MAKSIGVNAAFLQRRTLTNLLATRTLQITNGKLTKIGKNGKRIQPHETQTKTPNPKTQTKAPPHQSGLLSRAEDYGGDGLGGAVLVLTSLRAQNETKK